MWLIGRGRGKGEATVRIRLMNASDFRFEPGSSKHPEERAAMTYLRIREERMFGSG